jgi:hypothetical protein
MLGRNAECMRARNRISAWLTIFNLIMVVSGCVKDDEKYINLGQQFVVWRLHGGVTIEDMARTNDSVVPAEVISLVYNEQHIVAYAVTNHTTNVWVIQKSTRTVIGPLSTAQFEHYSATNPALQSMRQKDVWDY